MTTMTAIDAKKEAAQFVIKDAYAKSWVIRVQDASVSLPSEGVQKMNEGVYSVTDRALRRLQNNYTWHSDF